MLSTATLVGRSQIAPSGDVARPGRVRRAQQALRVVRFAIGALALFTVVAGTVAVVLTVVPTVFERLGVESVVITSGSMGPSVRRGDVLLFTPAAHTLLSRGDIAIFRDPTRPGLVTHRIVGVDETGRFVTKGDANPTADSTPLDQDQMVGAGVLVIPVVGIPRVWVADGDWLRLVGLGLMISLSVWASRFALRVEYDPWATTVATTDDPRAAGTPR
jgi:signal peptidase I